MRLAYRVLNVFTVDADPFSGNPLAVFEDAGSLDTTTMQSLARQLNLSETTFVTGVGQSAGADAAVRIFTPAYELPFAGHPTLGTAAVVADLRDGPDDNPGDGTNVVLRMGAGDVRVQGAGDRWTLTAARQPVVRETAASRAELAAMVGLEEDDVADGAAFVDTGVEQLILPLRSVQAVRRATADVAAIDRFGRSGLGEALVYLWAADEGNAEDLEARLFFTQGAGVVEDPATGSACANLGGWLAARGERGVRRTVRQGAAIDRPSRLGLEVDAVGGIHVTGTVHELGTGVMVI